MMATRQIKYGSKKCTLIQDLIKTGPVPPAKQALLASLCHTHPGDQYLACLLNMCNCFAYMATKFKQDLVQVQSHTRQCFCLAGITF